MVYVFKRHAYKEGEFLKFSLKINDILKDKINVAQFVDDIKRNKIDSFYKSGKRDESLEDSLEEI